MDAHATAKGKSPSPRHAVEARDKVARKEPEKVEKLLDLDTMELEVGYGLVRLVDTAKGGDLLERISLIRRQIAHGHGDHRSAHPHSRQHAALP